MSPVKNPCIVYSQPSVYISFLPVVPLYLGFLYIFGSVPVDSINHGLYTTAALKMGKKNLHVIGPTHFKHTLFKGQLYIKFVRYS